MPRVLHHPANKVLYSWNEFDVAFDFTGGSNRITANLDMTVADHLYVRHYYTAGVSSSWTYLYTYWFIPFDNAYGGGAGSIDCETTAELLSQSGSNITDASVSLLLWPGSGSVHQGLSVMYASGGTHTIRARTWNDSSEVYATNSPASETTTASKVWLRTRRARGGPLEYLWSTDGSTWTTHHTDSAYSSSGYTEMRVQMHTRKTTSTTASSHEYASDYVRAHIF